VVEPVPPRLSECEALKFDKFLVIAYGNADEMAKAKDVSGSPPRHGSSPIKDEADIRTPCLDLPPSFSHGD
jgi:hypothetical protein